MNFLERRKILKKANYLDLIPIRQVEHEVLDTGKIDILQPRFKNAVMKRAFQTRWRGEIIPIHLDALGSAIWLLIDGKSNVGELCHKLQETGMEGLTDLEETQKRVTKFVSLLYQERYITFHQIMPDRQAPGS